MITYSMGRSWNKESGSTVQIERKLLHLENTAFISQPQSSTKKVISGLKAH